MKSDCSFFAVPDKNYSRLCVFLQLITRAQRAAAQVMHDQVCARTCISVWLFCTGCYCSRVTLYAQRRPMAQCKMQALKSLSPLDNQIISSRRGAGRQLLNSHVFARQRTFASRKFSRSSSSRSMTT
jgi:hypothetical protein